MSVGDWRSKLSLGIAIALSCVWIGAATLRSLPAVRWLGYQPANYQTEDQRESARDQADTEAQVWMAYAAWAQVVIGTLGLLGLSVTIYFARKAWREAHVSAVQARRSADIAEREHREGNRGHLFATIDQPTIEFTGTNGTIPQVHFWLKNIGQRHVIVRVARHGLIHTGPRDALPEYAPNIQTSAGTLEPKLIEPGQVEHFDGTVFRSGGWLTQENWESLEGNVYFQIQVFYTDHLMMLREYGVTWHAYSPNDDWDGMFLYERGYDREVGQVGPKPY